MAVTVIGCLLSITLLACSNGRITDPGQQGVGTGVRVELDSDLSVTMLAVDTTIAASVDESPTPGPHWVVFEVLNSGDARVTLHARPVPPAVTDAAGNALEVVASRAQLSSGGGGWGPAAAHLGEPYLDSGGRMLTSFQILDLPSAAHPVTLEYAPNGDSTAVFVIK